MGEVQAKGMRQLPEFEERLRTCIREYPNVAAIFERQKWLDRQVNATSLTCLHPVAFWAIRELAYEYYGETPKTDLFEHLERGLERIQSLTGYKKLAENLSHPKRHFWDHMPEVDVACWLVEAGYSQLEFERSFPEGEPDIFVGEIPCAIEVKAITGRPEDTDLEEWDVRSFLQMAICKCPIGHIVTFEPPVSALDRLRFYSRCQVDEFLDLAEGWFLRGPGTNGRKARSLLAKLKGKVHMKGKGYVPITTKVCFDPRPSVKGPPAVLPGGQAFWEEVTLELLAKRAYRAALDKSSQLPKCIPGLVAVDASDDLAGSSNIDKIISELTYIAKQTHKCAHIWSYVKEWPDKVHAVFIFSKYTKTGVQRGCIPNPNSKWKDTPQEHALADLVSKWCSG